MRKLPRRSASSHAPSLAWVAFAVLLLAVAGGLGGVYAHRQNQETNRRAQIGELEREIAQLRETNEGLRDEFTSRISAAALKLALKEKNMPLQDIPGDRLTIVRPEAPAAAADASPTPPAELASAASR